MWRRGLQPNLGSPTRKGGHKAYNGAAIHDKEHWSIDNEYFGYERIYSSCKQGRPTTLLTHGCTHNSDDMDEPTTRHSEDMLVT